MQANAALRTIVRRDSGEGYREMLVRLAKESSIETPTAEDLIRLDRARKDKSLSNQDWRSPTDPDAKIAKLKDGRTHLAYKPEHAVDLDTSAIVAAELHPADQGDTATLPTTLMAAAEGLAAAGAAPTSDDPAELIADKGYHSRDGLKVLADSDWKTRIAEPAGTATTKPAAPSTTTTPACSPLSPARRSGSGPRRSNAASPSFSIAAACAGPGCGAATTFTN